MLNVILSEDISVDYLIDINKKYYKNYMVYSPYDILPKTDLIIVTTVAEYEKIKNQLGLKRSFNIISLEELIYRAMNNDKLIVE